MPHKTIYTTERAAVHQERALAAAPPDLDITMLRQPDADTLRAALVDAEYLISERVGVIDANLLAAAPRLKLILRLGSLEYDIDLEAARAAGVIVCRWPDVGVIRVAEHVVMLMLALARRLNDAQAATLAADPTWRESRRTDENTFAYNWSGRQSIGQLYGRTVSILGFGEIGAELARRLSGWGVTILYHKRRRLPLAVEAELGLNYSEQDALLAQSDYLVNLLPYAPETKLSLNAQTFARLKPGAAIVSCGSGGVIDEAALADALRAGQLAGAALDTYDWEPPHPDNPLIVLAQAHANVILTPHVAAGTLTPQAAAEERRAVYTNIVRHRNGQPLLYRLA
ncbi:MAG: hypothetical protein IT320_02050 [Anaerolineae bacterium]|nr:hypothetical protein [Anaerolineae bacterium]